MASGEVWIPASAGMTKSEYPISNKEFQILKRPAVKPQAKLRSIPVFGLVSIGMTIEWLRR
jgi:hypothetical protein